MPVRAFCDRKRPREASPSDTSSRHPDQDTSPRVDPAVSAAVDPHTTTLVLRPHNRARQELRDLAIDATDRATPVHDHDPQTASNDLVLHPRDIQAAQQVGTAKPEQPKQSGAVVAQEADAIASSVPADFVTVNILSEADDARATVVAPRELLRLCPFPFVHENLKKHGGKLTFAYVVKTTRLWVVQLYFDWLSSGDLISNLPKGPWAPAEALHEDPEIFKVGMCLQYAQKIRDSDFKDVCIDALLAVAKRRVEDNPEDLYPEYFAVVARHITTYCSGTQYPLNNKLIIDSFKHEMDVGVQRSIDRVYDGTGLARPDWRGSGPAFVDDGCVYHEHRELGKPCYKTRFVGTPRRSSPQ